MLILIVWLMLVIFMSVVWLISLLNKNPATVDVAWSFTLMMASFIYVLAQHNTLRNSLSLVVLLCWGLRLAGYLYFTRICKKHIDPRYQKVSQHWKINKAFGFWLNYQLQALLAMPIAISFYFIGASEQSLNLWSLFCLLLSISGIIGETIADTQLHRFKKNHYGQLCQKGLWYYSRHPNYFFECLVWLGFALMAIHSWLSLLALLSPLFLLFIFVKITGAITESVSLRSRGDAYRDYQKATSMIFLKKPKKMAHE
jgi:steroid 5-alpha reductase family enzyme